ncbi:MAG: plastocyanin/azurin family copper-binding protein [Verrucomicrobiales bacterium]
MKRSAFLVAAALMAATLSPLSCRKADTPATGTTESRGADGNRIVHMTGNDQLQFNLKEITASPGEKLTVELTNIGSMPKQAMAHNLLLLQSMPDADVNAFAMAATTRPPEYLPEDTSKVIAHTKMLGPKEKDSITFTVPATPGNYPYICSFPGHFTLMRGILVVRPN